MRGAGEKQRNPRVRVSDLREQIRDLQAKLDVVNGIQTADTNKLEWNRYADVTITRYRSFVAGASARLGVPRSFLLEGIEDGSIKNWHHARRVHEEAIHKAVAEGLPMPNLS